ncbi:MAG: bifunctional 5,10-methylenetetrahydrofolate dehydrogenase/5,10-methenyltetrahydrofolate cyclohydrolase [Stellaceae bacterium]
MGGARIIDGKAIAGELRRCVADAAKHLQDQMNVTPGLAAILVGDDPASQVYVGAKSQACAAVGIASSEYRLPPDASPAAVIARVEALNADDRIDGILVQLPLPQQIDADRVVAAIDPEKDVDGFHPLNVGLLWSGLPGFVPCTPLGCLLLLRSVLGDLGGADTVVLGRSNVVGRPMAALLLAADCAVTILHSKSRDAGQACRRADIVVSSTGRPRLVGADWIKPGATVIDVGIQPMTMADGTRQLVGDVDFAAVRQVAGAITPVPGGVGPMTIACLLRNTLIAACRRRGLPEPAT